MEEETTAPEPAPEPVTSSGWDDEPEAQETPDPPKEQENEDTKVSKNKDTAEKDTKEKSDEKATEDDDKTKATPKKKYIRIGDDLIEEEEALKLREKAKGADRVFREAAEMRKKSQEQVQNFFEAFMKDPQKILSHPKLNIPLEQRKTLGESLLRQAIEHELADPKDIKLSEYEQKVKQYEERENQEKAEREQQEEQQKVETRRKEISQQLAKAMEATPLSKDPAVAAETLRDMATYLRMAREKNVDLTPEEIAEHVNNNRYKQYYALSQQLSGEDLIKFLGDDTVNKIMTHNLDTIKKRRGEKKQQQPQKAWNPSRQQPTDKKSQRMDPQDARDMVRRNLGLE